MRLPLKQMKWKQIALSNIYVVSLVITMVILLMKKNDLLIQTSLFSETSLREVREHLAGDTTVFFYILKERLSIVFALFLLATTSLGSIYVHMNVMWYGISSGLFLTIVLMRYGVKGILLLIAGMFPHYLIYVPAVALTLHLTKDKRIVNSKFLGQLFVITVVVIIGCVLECYVNPEVVAKLLKNF